jgi:hypothetical protein
MQLQVGNHQMEKKDCMGFYVGSWMEEILENDFGWMNCNGEKSGIVEIDLKFF